MAARRYLRAVVVDEQWATERGELEPHVLVLRGEVERVLDGALVALPDVR